MRTIIKSILLIGMLLVGLQSRAFDIGQLSYSIRPDFPNAVNVSVNYDDEIVEAIIPETVSDGNITYTVVSMSGFLSCPNLEMIYIPKTISIISPTVGNGSDKLHSIIVDDENPDFASFGNVVYTKDLSSIILCPYGITDLVLPDTFSSVPENAFSGKKQLQTAELPETIRSIENSAFSGCSSLVTINFPENLEKIGNSAFSGCRSLASVNFPDNLEKIDNSAFSGCSSLATVSFPPTLQEIGYFAFSGCSQLSDEIVIPESVGKLGSQAFAYCKSLKSVRIEAPVEVLQDYLFAACSSLESIEFKDDVKELAPGAFLSCSSLPYIFIPASVTKIGSETFVGCSALTDIDVALENEIYSSEEGMILSKDRSELISWPSAQGKIKIPDFITYLGGAFYNNKLLSEVEIPAPVTEIGSLTFCGCTSLKKIVMLSPIPPTAGLWWLSEHEMSGPMYVEIYVPAQSLELYQETWPDLKKQLFAIPDSDVTCIENDTPSSLLVYSLDGKFVMRTNSWEDLNSLSKGTYIINGKKVVL